MAYATFGKGQFVQHALLQNEQWHTLLTSLEEFKANNPAWRKLRCVLIDKGFAEMSVLKKAFPGVVILLCQFHVLKYLREEIAGADYGFSAWQKEQLRGVMSLLVYAKINMEYERHLGYLEHLASIGYSAPRHVISTGVDFSTGAHEPTSEGQLESSVGQQLGSVGSESGTVGNVGNLSTSDTHGTGAREQASTECASHPFITYFMKNWDNCREQWCAHKHQNTVTLGNNTNSRLEASWKQLKEWVDSFMSVDECIASIMCYQRLQERRFMDEVNKKVNVQHIGYDHEMTLVTNLVSEHA
ncbi:unnamed protein product [Phytophthora fragariaefolia]|uniref:Unnamed protein product n=1 Tax=Phytophthora fragariaefolia TaxID=1490495 RepID=A0A9W7CQR5_9STRA|nr:unnamed protein product [Phytophthora fragariaefolia]